MCTKTKKWMFAAALTVMISAAVASAQTNKTVDTAYVPFVVVNTDATVKVYNHSMLMAQKAVAKNVEVTIAVPLSGGGGSVSSNNTGVLSGAQRQLNAPAIVSNRNGKIALNLSPQSYKNAEIALYTVNGKRVLRGQASAADAAASVSRRDLTPGVYLLSVKGRDGNAFSSRVTHRGGNMDISVAFSNEALSPSRTLAKESAELAEGDLWSVVVSSSGYIDSAYTLGIKKGKDNAKQTITLKAPTATSKASFTEKVGSVSFDMVYIPGGTFTIGCEKSSGCPSDTKPVSGVKVSSYFIGKTEVSQALWNAVMGKSGGSNSTSYTSMTWYEAFDFACRLSQITGRRYRMTTEAEWEYAAKNHISSLEKIANGSGISGEEWAYNSWLGTHAGGTDPVGPSSGQHTQKTRRDANGYGDNITARLIRSIEGVGPALRLAISAEMDYPPGYVPSCDLHAPVMTGEPDNSYRDPRWITDGGAQWKPDGTIAIGSFTLQAWEDGTARLNSTNGQWFTSNNIAFVFVPSSGTVKKFAYIFVDETHASLISDQNFMNGFVGRIGKTAVSSATAKPTVADLKSGEALAKAQTNFATDFQMVDMTSIPASAQKQDSRLLDGGADKGWFQDNTSAGGLHHYRKDIDLDEFRFTVNQGNGRTMLANGKWFTVNNTFLRVTHSNGYTCEYLYTLTPDGTFYHNSYQGYERGDFRMFKKETNGASWPKTTCGNICSEEIPKGLASSMYNGMANGKSTFIPAPCPAGGCK